MRIQDIPVLLHAAQLLAINWQPELAQVSLVFDCLRRNTDGSELADRRVEICLSGVERIAAYYNPADIAVCPSRFRLERVFSVADLRDWRFPPTEAFLYIDSEESLFTMRTSWRIDWLEDNPVKQRADRSAMTVHLQFDQHDYSETACQRGLYFECDGIRSLSSGAALDLDEWEAQFGAWWKSWEDYWKGDATTDEADDKEPLEEDHFIPAGEGFQQDLAYKPPAEPAFLVSQTDAPPALLDPIRNMVEGILDRDWQRVAVAWPDFDKNLNERAEELGQQYLGHEFGRWVYVRQVDKWWEEGGQAYVAIRGIEHTAPDDEDPAANLETVIGFALRKSDQGWRLLTSIQGWPVYGSADSFDGSKPWLDGWALERE